MPLVKGPASAPTPAYWVALSLTQPTGLRNVIERNPRAVIEALAP